MKKNQIFIAAGTLALAIAGFFTSKANNKKYTTATSAYYYTNGVGSSVVTVFAGVTTGTPYHLSTVKGTTGKTSFFRTVSSTAKTLFAVNTSGVLSKTVFFK